MKKKNAEGSIGSLSCTQQREVHLSYLCDDTHTREHPPQQLCASLGTRFPFSSPCLSHTCPASLSSRLRQYTLDSATTRGSGKRGVEEWKRYRMQRESATRLDSIPKCKLEKTQTEKTDKKRILSILMPAPFFSVVKGVSDVFFFLQISSPRRRWQRRCRRQRR